MSDRGSWTIFSRLALPIERALARPDWTAETARLSVAPGTAKTWFPGYYVLVPPDTFATNNKSWRVLQGADGRLFAGLHVSVTWGQIETTRGEFRWDKIDSRLNALPPGKKLSLSLSWQGWGGMQTCPNGMLENPADDSGPRVRGAKQARGRQRRSDGHFATGKMAGDHNNSHFCPHVLANAGKWPCWMGVEWQDLGSTATAQRLASYR